MKKELLTTLMKDSIFEVLSTMFFTPVEFDENALPEDIFDFFNQENSNICKIKIEGENGIILYGVLTKESIYDLARDFTCKDDVSESDCEGTFKEIFNMICGGVLASSHFGSDHRLTIPEVVSKEVFLKEIEKYKEEKIFLKGLLLNGELNFICIQK